MNFTHNVLRIAEPCSTILEGKLKLIARGHVPWNNLHLSLTFTEPHCKIQLVNNRKECLKKLLQHASYTVPFPFATEVSNDKALNSESLLSLLFIDAFIACYSSIKLNISLSNIEVL